MSKQLKWVLVGGAVWSVGVFAWQRTQGIITIGGQTLPGFLDPLGMIFGYPNAVQVTIGDPIEQ
jgi:hypothetical protein